MVVKRLKSVFGLFSLDFWGIFAWFWRQIIFRLEFYFYSSHRWLMVF